MRQMGIAWLLDQKRMGFAHPDFFEERTAQ